VPDHTTFDAAASDAGWSCPDGSPAGSPCTFLIGGLAAGASSSVAFAVTVDQTLPAGVTEIANAVGVTHDGETRIPATTTPWSELPSTPPRGLTSP